ncbi:cytochrome C [Myxococcus stipitatus]|uniref:cytochrome C n=1 Tax=Myxococcus stipitatus TaxID=83455 RepID=UPI003144EA2F
MGGLGAPWSQRAACTPRSLGCLTARRALLTVALAAVLSACGGPEDAGSPDDDALATADPAHLDVEAARRPVLSKPIGLALEVDNGEGKPLSVRAGATFYINQIDLRASVRSTFDTGMWALRTTSDLAGVGWVGLRPVDEEPVLLGGPGRYTRRRFYRGAAWMDLPSFFIVEPVDSRGVLTGPPVVLNIGAEHQRRPTTDDFFVRRLRAIQTAYDCTTPRDCTSARDYEEEALLEVRNAYQHAQQRAFSLSPRTTSLRLRWSLRPFAPYSIPVQQVSAPEFAYGFGIDVEARTPPRQDGTYAPGSEITFQVTLRDGEGKRLHPQGSLPSYNDVVRGFNAAGIQYYRAFFDATTTYYRRKHRERMLMTQIIGPAQNIQPIRSVIDLDAFLDPEVNEQTVATEKRDGVFSQFSILPYANIVFRGAFFPEEGLWDRPNTDTWQYRIPANATPGTYLVTVKGRRVYLGEDLPASRTIEIQVGTQQRTEAKLTTGPCNSCHSQGAELSQVLHGNDNRAACAGCHTPLGFELEGPIFVRTHFVHSRSNRFGAPLEKCASCHLTKESIQRTSQAACLSCHKSYPDSHVKKFGPIESMYVGGGRESFKQCTDSCHTRHPKSGL